MNIGTQLIVIGTVAKTYFTPWYPTGADNAIFTYEVIHKNFGSGGGISVTVFTKNREDSGSAGMSYTNFIQIGSTDFYHLQCANLKQLVRLQITITPGAGPTGPEGVCYRLLAPTWITTAS